MMNNLKSMKSVALSPQPGPLPYYHGGFTGSCLVGNAPSDPVNPKTGVGEHTRPRVLLDAPRVQPARAQRAPEPLDLYQPPMKNG
jgi:hypothetical protein